MTTMKAMLMVVCACGGHMYLAQHPDAQRFRIWRCEDCRREALDSDLVLIHG